MKRTSLRTRMTRMVALLAAMLMLAALAGCSSAKKETTVRGGAETPIAESQLVRGSLPGVQVVAVAKLPKADQGAVASWVAGGRAVGQAPVLAAGSYTPDIDGHVLEAAREVGSDNGIATSLITLNFDPEGAQLLTNLTTAEAGKDLAVVVGGRVIMVTQVAEPATNGQLVIEGPRELIDSVAKSIVATL
jgi:preprotein translocase subunit SecD